MTVQQIEDACRKRLKELPGLRDRADKNYTDNARTSRLENLEKEEQIIRMLCEFFDAHRDEMPSSLAVRPHKPGDLRVQRHQRYQSVPDWMACCKDEREIRIVQDYIDDATIANIARREEVSANRVSQILDHVARMCYWTAQESKDE